MAVELTRGKGRRDENAALVNMINEVFCPNRDDGFDFYKLLPKLYEDKYNPAQHNYVVREDGVIKGAVGLFYSTVTLGKDSLLCGGIGNVAVTLDCRSKGYMKDCMGQALDDMIASGADVGFLGGQRQRYQYFSFELGGVHARFNLGLRNMNHVYGKDLKTDMSVAPLTADDTAALDEAYALYCKKPLHFDRPREDFHNYLLSWDDQPVKLVKNGEFRGYFINCGEYKAIGELTLKDTAELKDAVIAILNASGNESFSLGFPMCDTEYIDFFTNVAESYGIDHSEHMTVLNYRNTLEVMLRFRSTYRPLCDCECTVLIHGKRADEQLHISIKNNTVSVTDTTEAPDIELEHLEAVSTFFGLINPRESELPAGLSANLPLPFFVYGADNV